MYLLVSGSIFKYLHTYSSTATSGYRVCKKNKVQQYFAILNVCHQEIYLQVTICTWKAFSKALAAIEGLSSSWPSSWLIKKLWYAVKFQRRFPLCSLQKHKSHNCTMIFTVIHKPIKKNKNVFHLSYVPFSIFLLSSNSRERTISY